MPYVRYLHVVALLPSCTSRTRQAGMCALASMTKRRKMTCIAGYCTRLWSCATHRSHSTVSADGFLKRFSMSELKKMLKSHSKPLENGYTCVLIDCPVCVAVGHQVQHSWRAYINKTTGYFVCHDCGHCGDWEVMERLIAGRKNGKLLSAHELQSVRKQCVVSTGTVALCNTMYSTTVPLEGFPCEEQRSILANFGLPDVSEVGVALFEIRTDTSKSLLYFPLRHMGGHVCGYKVLRVGGEEVETVPQTGCCGLYSTKLQPKVAKQEPAAILVPSVADVLALAHHQPPGQVLCLPHGLNSLPQQLLPSLERYHKLVLWFGNDIGSWDAARNFAKKLDEKRCHFVRPTDRQPAPHKALTQCLDLRAIAAAAQPIWHQAITAFASLRQDVLSELQNDDKVQGVKWKRFPPLNRMLKGHRRGEFTVLTGPTGCGKTTFMSEYSLDLAMQGVCTLWGSFEIRNARLARTMLQQMAGTPLDADIALFDSWADTFEQLPLYFMTFHGQQSIKVVMEAVEHATYVHDIAHIIIDNVQFMMGTSEEQHRHADRFWKQDTIVACFRMFATRANCHVTLVIHPRKEREADDLTINSIFGSAKAAQEADNVLIIQDKRLTSLRGKKYLQVAKNRYSGDLGVMTLEFDKDSLSYGYHKRKAAKNPKQQPANEE